MSIFSRFGRKSGSAWVGRTITPAPIDPNAPQLPMGPAMLELIAFNERIEAAQRGAPVPATEPAVAPEPKRNRP